MSEALQSERAVQGLEVRRHPRWTYIRYALLHPANLMFLVALAALGSALESLTVVLMGALVEGIGCALAPRWSAFRRLVDSRLAYEKRLERNRERDERLLEVETRHRDEVADLNGIVEEVERNDRELARCLELQDLLDRYIDLAIAHRRCINAMRCADRRQLGQAIGEMSQRRDGPKLTALQNRRRAILSRRVRHWDACRERARELEEEIAAVADFIRLIGQKSLCPDVEEELSEELEQRLGDLEETESALRRLNAA